MHASENLFDFAEGQRRQQIGLAKVASGYGTEDWLPRARAWAKALAAENGDVTIEDVYRKVGLPPRPNLAGHVFKGKTFRRVGIDIANRPERQGGTFMRWSLA